MCLGVQCAVPLSPACLGMIALMAGGGVGDYSLVMLLVCFMISRIDLSKR